MEKEGPIQIDVRQALASKLGSKVRFVPGFAINWLKRVICQDELNHYLREYYPRTGADLCSHAIADFGVKVDVFGRQNLPSAANRRIIFVCNHPLGGFDGIVLIAELCRLYGSGVRVVVNDLLMAMGPLAECFLPINKHGAQSRKAISDINEALDGDEPILIFPAGLVSRQSADGSICDLQWHKMFVSKALQYRRDVVPLFFDGRNSAFFYRLARWRKRLGIKFNIEMLRLPKEMLSCRGKTFGIAVGKRIPWTELAGADHLQTAQNVKQITYSLKSIANNESENN